MTRWEYIEYSMPHHLVITGKDNVHSVAEAVKARLAELDRKLQVSEVKTFFHIETRGVVPLDVLNALGAEGWEAVGYAPNGKDCLLKRPT